jgi:broad specificity phosphatase PhoE
MTIFFLIRHGDTDWLLNHRYQLKGEYRDLPSLTPLGIKQASDISKNIKLEKAEFILSSPYTRALQTAAIISKNTSLDITVEYDLREWQPDLNLEISNQTQLKTVIEDYEKENGIYPPNVSKPWESKSAVKKRAENVLRKYTSHKYVIVVTHEQVIKSWIVLKNIPKCSINELELVI